MGVILKAYVLTCQEIVKDAKIGLPRKRKAFWESTEGHFTKVKDWSSQII